MGIEKHAPLVAKGIAAGRVLYGIACMVAPKKMMGPDADGAPGPLIFMVRTFGVRDVVLGAGTFKAVSEGTEAGRLWTQISAAADTIDVANAALFRKELNQRGVAATLSLAVPAALGGWWSSRSL